MSKHTPGPWAIKFRNDHSAYISLGDPVSGPHKQFDVQFTDLYPSDVADARLIVAAPDLLAALDGLLRWIPVYPLAADGIVGGREAHATAIKAARAAIAKAKGVQG